MARDITFHENGRAYVWHKASGCVYSERGAFITSNARTLEYARTVVRAVQARDMKQREVAQYMRDGLAARNAAENVVKEAAKIVQERLW